MKGSRPGAPARGPAPELLAPAGSPEAFRAAIAAGADAVYLSGKQFGARKFAANFSDSEIREAVEYAHARGVRVYVTVNTLVHDRELAGAGDHLLRLYEAGVDAVLVQDTGVAALAREILPDLPLHASTQMTIHNSAGVRWAAEHGISRVVLARELTLPEVKRIRQETRDTGTGLEVFAHGALCYSYSGACLLSSVIGGRSGNRGMCAQPCRKPYTLVTGDTDRYGRPQNLQEIRSPEHYLLSPRDLCTYGRLPDLWGTVSSLKIEGRMKSPQYVAVVVSAYRRALDAIAEGTFRPDNGTLRDLSIAFSRGFTNGYLLGDRHDALMARAVPDNRGLEIGVVTRYDPKSRAAVIRLRGSYVPQPGDGIRFSLGNAGENFGFSLNTVPVQEREGIRIPVPRDVPSGSVVHVTFSRELENRANRIIADPPQELLRPLPLELSIRVRPDGSIAASGRVIPPGREPVPFSLDSDLRMEPARSHPVTREALARQMAKTGGSPFIVRKLDLDYPGDRFAPVAVLNQVRRGLLAAAGAALSAASRPAPESVDSARRRWSSARERYTIPAGLQNPDSPSGIHLTVYADTLDGVKAAIASGAETVCFEPPVPMPQHRCGPAESPVVIREMVQEAHDLCRTAGIRLVWKFPRITRDAELDLLLPLLPGLVHEGLRDLMAENPGTAAAVLRAAPGIRLHAGPGLGIFNSTAARAAGEMFQTLTLSPELSGDEIAVLTSRAARDGTLTSFSLVVHGAAEAMVTDDCIQRLVPWLCPRAGNPARNGVPAFLGIRDETGRIFPIRADGSCRTTVGNSAELCLLDHLPAIRRAGITGAAIDCRGKPAEYTAEMTRVYREAIDRVNAGSGTTGDPELDRLREGARKISCGGITAGHFTKGLAE